LIWDIHQVPTRNFDWLPFTPPWSPSPVLHIASDEITTCGYRALTFAKCTTVMTIVLTVTSGLESSLDSVVWFGWGWDGFGLACVELYDL
jgi:hypothetical protein